MWLDMLGSSVTCRGTVPRLVIDRRHAERPRHDHEVNATRPPPARTGAASDRAGAYLTATFGVLLKPAVVDVPV